VVDAILSFNSGLFLALHLSLEAGILFTALAGRVSHLRVLVSNANLLLQSLFFKLQFFDAVLDQHLFSLTLAQLQFGLEFAGALHASNVLFVFRRHRVNRQGSKSQEVTRQLHLIETSLRFGGHEGVLLAIVIVRRLATHLICVSLLCLSLLGGAAVARP